MKQVYVLEVVIETAAGSRVSVPLKGFSDEATCMAAARNKNERFRATLGLELGTRDLANPQLLSPVGLDMAKVLQGIGLASLMYGFRAVEVHEADVILTS